MNTLPDQKTRLLKELIDTGYLRSQAGIDAFRKIRRENFVPVEHKKYAYVNEPLPIGEGQTISQPLTVAAMTEALDVKKGNKILEVGTGSGYQAAILSLLAGKSGKVITTERLGSLFDFAKKNLEQYKNVTLLHRDGSQGYEKEAPYDRIIVTASAPKIPRPLLDQLKPGGRLVIPVGDEMFLVEMLNGEKFNKTSLGYYVFVPLKGKHGYE